eukprot:CAMPEP_0172686006 /NCGR_PEP_ID=MMETSP1074-20121228/20625_1 /TAXON_ID=2916 /ORGANISM="Ceratium fusus, Strain PA161109" /LENGTH=480 /DNA_ID=CAMNT_0013505251 /DNA_START=168 /DNA_END=1610 /DNA_ORIENTATION=+
MTLRRHCARSPKRLALPTGSSEDGISERDLDILRQRIGRLNLIEDAAWCEAKVTGPRPSARVWHTVNEVGGKDQLLMFGGADPYEERLFNELWMLNVPQSGQASWQLVKTHGDMPAPRAHHDAFVLSSRWFVVHGGLLENGCRSSDTWRIDLNSAEPRWEELGKNPVIPRPTPRYHHSLVATESGKLILFGGHNYARTALNDAWILDANGRDAALAFWKELFWTEELPAPRAYHSATMVGEYMLISGGELKDRSSSNELWALDTARLAWHRVPVVNSRGDEIHHALGYRGCMRHMSCCVDVQKGLVAICGGHDQSASNALPLDCTLLQFYQKKQAKSGESFACRVVKWPVDSQQEASGGSSGTASRLLRDAALFHLPSGHLALLGGNDGELTDAFGDGYHQFGCKEVQVADTAGKAVGHVGSWRPVFKGAPADTSCGSAVAMLGSSSRLVVIDYLEEWAQVHVLVLDATANTRLSGSSFG